MIGIRGVHVLVLHVRRNWRGRSTRVSFVEEGVGRVEAVEARRLDGNDRLRGGNDVVGLAAGVIETDDRRAALERREVRRRPGVDRGLRDVLVVREAGREERAPAEGGTGRSVARGLA